MVTKWVAVRAVNLSIGAFCTEFRCESFYDGSIFVIGSGSRPSGREINHRGWENGQNLGPGRPSEGGYPKKKEWGYPLQKSMGFPILLSLTFYVVTPQKKNGVLAGGM